MKHTIINNDIFGNRQGSEFSEAIKNSKDFDIYAVSEEEYFNSLHKTIYQVIEMREDVKVCVSDMELRKKGSYKKRIITLQDGNIYPWVSFVINMKRRGLPRFYRINITPFTAWLDEVGSCGKNYSKKEKVTTTMLTKAIKDCHTQLFGEKFAEKFKEYHQSVKDQRVQKVEEESRKEIEEINNLYNTII